jgi:hypothetical protein
LWGTLNRKYVDVEEDIDNNTIKLGLGDFVFYSVLVSKAALFDFTALAATFVVVLLVRRVRVRARVSVRVTALSLFLGALKCCTHAVTEGTRKAPRQTEAQTGGRTQTGPAKKRQPEGQKSAHHALLWAPYNQTSRQATKQTEAKTRTNEVQDTTRRRSIKIKIDQDQRYNQKITTQQDNPKDTTRPGLR